MGEIQQAGKLDERQQGLDDGQYTTVPYTANPQILPEWLSYTTYALTEGDVVRTVQSVVSLPLTYYGPSIPLDDSWTYGGLTSPVAEATSVSPEASSVTAESEDSPAETVSVAESPSLSPLSSSPASSSLSGLPSATSSSAVSSSQFVSGSLSSTPSATIPKFEPNSSSSLLPPASTTVAPESATPAPDPSGLSTSELLASILTPTLVVGTLLLCCILCIGCRKRHRRTRKESSPSVPSSRRGGWRSVSLTDPDAAQPRQETSIPAVSAEARTNGGHSDPPMSPRSPVESDSLLGTAAAKPTADGKQQGLSLLSKMASAGAALGILGSHRKSSAIILEAGDRKRREPSAGGADITTAYHSEMEQRSSTPVSQVRSRNESSSGNAPTPGMRRSDHHPFTEHMSPDELFFQAPPHTASTFMTSHSRSQSASGTASKTGSSNSNKRLSSKLPAANNSPGQYSIAIPETPVMEAAPASDDAVTASGGRRPRFLTGADRLSFPLPPPPPPKSPKRERESWVSAVEDLGIPVAPWTRSSPGARSSGINSAADHSSYHSASSSPPARNGDLLPPGELSGKAARPNSMTTFGVTTPTSSYHGHPPSTPPKLISPLVTPNLSPSKGVPTGMLFGSPNVGSNSSKDTSSSTGLPNRATRESYSSYPGQPLVSQAELQELVERDEQPTLSAVQSTANLRGGPFGEFGQPLRSVSGSTAQLMPSAAGARDSVVASVYSGNASSSSRSPSAYSQPSGHEVEESLGYSTAAVRGKRSLPQLVPASLVGRSPGPPTLPAFDFGSSSSQNIGKERTKRGLSRLWPGTNS